jgi:hypothetical protein
MSPLLRHDGAVVTGDVAHATYVRGQRVHIVDTCDHLAARTGLAQIAHQELVGARVPILGPFEVHRAHPETPLLERCHQVAANEAARPGHQSTRLSRDVSIPS